jgi:hypothetical protein
MDGDEAVVTCSDSHSSRILNQCVYHTHQSILKVRRYDGVNHSFIDMGDGIYDSSRSVAWDLHDNLSLQTKQSG